MIYGFTCDGCNARRELKAKAFHPPAAPFCSPCGQAMRRLYGCNIDTSGCRDPDDVAPEHRIAVSQERNLSSTQTASIEAAHRRDIEKTRRDLADGGNRGDLRLTHKIPAALHAAKIKESGDPRYWDDPKNRARHSSCKVD